MKNPVIAKIFKYLMIVLGSAVYAAGFQFFQQLHHAREHLYQLYEIIVMPAAVSIQAFLQRNFREEFFHCHFQRFSQRRKYHII